MLYSANRRPNNHFIDKNTFVLGCKCHGKGVFGSESLYFISDVEKNDCYVWIHTKKNRSLIIVIQWHCCKMQNRKRSGAAVFLNKYKTSKTKWAISASFCINFKPFAWRIYTYFAGLVFEQQTHHSFFLLITWLFDPVFAIPKSNELIEWFPHKFTWSAVELKQNSARQWRTLKNKTGTFCPFK